MESFSGICAANNVTVLENLHQFSRKSQRTRTGAWQKLHVQNDPNRAEFIIDAGTRTCVRAFNAPLRGARIAMLYTSRKNITIQLHLARRKMIRILVSSKCIYSSVGAIISYDVTHTWLWGRREGGGVNLEIQALLWNILLTKTVVKTLSKYIYPRFPKIFAGQN